MKIFCIAYCRLNTDTRQCRHTDEVKWDKILHNVTCASLRWKTKVTRSNHLYLVVVALLSFICKKNNWRINQRQVSRSTPFPESAFFSFLISALGKEGKRSHNSTIFMIHLKTNTALIINYSCCIAQTGKQVKDSVLNGAEDNSQHLSDEIGKRMQDGQTDRSASMQARTATELLFFLVSFEWQIKTVTWSSNGTGSVLCQYLHFHRWHKRDHDKHFLSFKCILFSMCI